MEPNMRNDGGFGQRYSETYDPALGVPVAAAPAAVRAAFLQKVYMTLCGGVAIALFTAFQIVSSAVQGNPGVLKAVTGHYWMVAIGYIVLALGAGALARVRGVNVAVYVAFTAFTGLLISPLFAYAYIQGHQSFEIVWNAFGLTALVFGGLTVYVFWSGKDFSFLGGMLWVGLLVLLGFMIATFFFQSPAFAMGVTVGGLLLFAGFILYDTSQIIHRLGPQDWMAGALSLFIDFVNMFIRILSLLSSRR